VLPYTFLRYFLVLFDVYLDEKWSSTPFDLILRLNNSKLLLLTKKRQAAKKSSKPGMIGRISVCRKYLECTLRYTIYFTGEWRHCSLGKFQTLKYLWESAACPKQTSKTAPVFGNGSFPVHTKALAACLGGCIFRSRVVPWFNY